MCFTTKLVKLFMSGCIILGAKCRGLVEDADCGVRTEMLEFYLQILSLAYRLLELTNKIMRADFNVLR